MHAYPFLPDSLLGLLKIALQLTFFNFEFANLGAPLGLCLGSLVFCLALGVLSRLLCGLLKLPRCIPGESASDFIRILLQIGANFVRGVCPADFFGRRLIPRCRCDRRLDD